MIDYEISVCRELNMPAIPKKEWDGVKSFKTGVAVLDIDDTRKMYGIVTFNSDTDKEPRVIKVFSLEQFQKISKIYIVPDYMDTDVENMDLDDESKNAAQAMLEEAKELQGEDDEEKVTLPDNEFYFDHITNDDQAAAFIKDYNKRNRIKGRVPTTHEGLVMRLSVIYSETTNGKTSKKKRK